MLTVSLFLRSFLFVLIFFILSIFPAQGVDNPDLEEIRRIETLLLVPCNEPLNYMNELVRLGREYQEQERRRLSLYRSALDAHRLALSAFIVTTDAKAGTETGPFRAKYDQLYRQAREEGLIREASYSDIQDGYSMADVAANVQQYNAQSDRDLRGPIANVGSWSKEQKGLGNQLFFVEAQRQSVERMRTEMAQLKADWQAARTEYLKKMTTDPFRDVFVELDKRAAIMTKDIAPIYGKHRQDLGILFQSGRFEHCLGAMVETQAYLIKGGYRDLAPYLPGSPGTFEALPGVGFRMEPPAHLERIQVSPNSIPEDFPLDLPLKYDPQLYIKAEIERFQIQVKAEQDAIIAIGKHLTGLDGWVGQVVGEGFNVFHGFCEGFGGIGNILIGVGTAPFHPIETYQKIQGIKDGMVKLLIDSDLQRELVDRSLVATADFFRGIGASFELMTGPSDPPAEQYDTDTLSHWKAKAENTYLARNTLTAVENLAGQILSDLMTGAILSKGAKAAQLADDAVDTASDLSRAGAKAKKIEDASDRFGKVADDVPDVKTIDRLGEELRKCQDNVHKIIEDITTPKPKDIHYAQSMVPKPEDVLAKAAASTDRGGMNAYFRLNDDLGVKVGNKEIFKSSTKVDDALASRASRDLDDAGRRFLEDVTRDSPLGRLPQVKDRYYIVDDLFEGPKTYRSLDAIPDNTRYRVVEVMENINPSSHAGKLAEAGKLTPDHVRAYEAFMRDMNAKGYIWTDNKLDNFAFETIDASKGLYRVVPLDTGGIYKVSNLPVGTPPGEMARKLQVMYDRGFEAPGGSQANMLFAQLQEADKLGIPPEIIDDLPRYLGVQAINPTAQDVAATWAGGMRISSPGKSYSTIYAQVADKSTGSLNKEIGEAFDACLDSDPRFQSAWKTLNDKKTQLSQVEKKIDEAIEKVDKADEAARDFKFTGSPDRPVDSLAAATIQHAATEAEQAQEKAQCLAVMEKMLTGIKADWITETWKKCQDLGFIFQVAQ